MENDLSTMVGKTFTNVEGGVDEDSLVFRNNDEEFEFFHYQDCCEQVYIESITGDLSDLVGVPILKAEEVTSYENPAGVTIEYQDSFTWTFYKFATIKGYVDVRWYGESNGYYSESVSVKHKVKKA